MSKLSLRSAVAYAVVSNGDLQHLHCTLKVLRYCRTIAEWRNVILFAPRDLVPEDGIEQVQIPHFDDAPYGPNHQILMAKVIPTMLLAYGGAHNMWIHEDGFPIEPTLWTPDFLRYDYIGPVWEDGVVGGGGMSMRSSYFCKMAGSLPFMTEFGDGHNEDEYFCRKHRVLLESLSVKFAPPQLANRYCTELVNNDRPSFGFHGRKHSPEKYKLGWEKVDGVVK